MSDRFEAMICRKELQRDCVIARTRFGVESLSYVLYDRAFRDYELSCILFSVECRPGCNIKLMFIGSGLR